MDLLDLFSCQLHHIAFDRLKSHTPLPCPGTQSINITLKFRITPISPAPVSPMICPILPIPISPTPVSPTGERGGSVVECRTPEREVRGSKPTAAVLCPWARHFTPRKYWLSTQEAMAPSRHDWKIVDWDVKPQHNQPTNPFRLLWKFLLFPFGLLTMIIADKGITFLFLIFLWLLLLFTFRNKMLLHKA